MLKKGEAQFEWDETIFNFTLEKAVVHKDKSITFKFYSGYEVTIKAERVIQNYSILSRPDF